MAKYSSSWADELCADHWTEESRWKEGGLSCISDWTSLWDYQPSLLRRSLATLNPRRSDSIESFSIRQLGASSANGPRVVYVNGLFSQSDEAFADWQSAGCELFSAAFSYGVSWESRRTGRSGDVIRLAAIELASLYKSYGTSLVWSWHYTALKAADTGRLLAQILMRARGQEFVLCGHSLGARVIFYALVELAAHGRNDVVRTVHLMGGAVGTGDREMWTQALGACPGGVANYYSSHDDVLKHLYIPAMGFLSAPIGRNPLLMRGVRNCDVSDIVSGHTQYKEQFPRFIRYPLGL